MASNNTVTLTFAGDSERLTRTMADVGSGAKTMADDVQAASKSMADAGSGFDSAAEGFDRAEQRAMGFRDTITGVQDSVKGFGAVLKGDFSGDALLTAGMGVGDLASGFSNFLVPAMKNAVTWLGNTRVGMAAATAAQWLWNAALSANPIGIIILAIIALIGVFVLLWNKCDWFRNLWIGLWDGIKSVASAVWDWLQGVPDMIGQAFSRLPDFITAPFRAAFNFISDAWNNTIGKLSWTVPSWVPIIGGNTISVPQLRRFHGGIERVPGAPGTEMLAILQAGERVSRGDSSTSGPVNILRPGDSEVGDFIIGILARAIGDRGGNVQVVLGR